MAKKVAAVEDETDESADESKVDDTVMNEGGESVAEVRKKVLSLTKTVDESYVEMSRLLFKVHAGSYWSDWGHESFEDYVKEELGFEERKAKYLVAIWKRLRVDLNVSRKKLERLGWTKAKEILRVVDEKNIDDWLDKAYSMKVSELQKAVKKRLGKKGADEDFHTVNFKLSTEQYENVEEAIEQAKIEADTDKRGHAFDVICTEWKAGKLKPTEKLPWILKQIERVFGVKLIALRDEAVAKRIIAMLKSGKIEKGSKVEKLAKVKASAESEEEPETEETEEAEEPETATAE